MSQHHSRACFIYIYTYTHGSTVLFCFSFFLREYTSAPFSSYIYILQQAAARASVTAVGLALYAYSTQAYSCIYTQIRQLLLLFSLLSCGSFITRRFLRARARNSLCCFRIAVSRIYTSERVCARV